MPKIASRCSLLLVVSAVFFFSCWRQVDWQEEGEPASLPQNSVSSAGPQLHPSPSPPMTSAAPINPPSCSVQPNREPLPSIKECRLPGLNNLLYTQHSRWYCALRDGITIYLRDRSCEKSSMRPFRYSELLAMDHAAARRLWEGEPFKKSNGSLCWSDAVPQTKLIACEWKQIHYQYGKSKWWDARRLIDFRPIYYAAAREYLAEVMKPENRRFISVHLRRGDYLQHCVYIAKRKPSPWVSFLNKTKVPSLADNNVSLALTPKRMDYLRRENEDKSSPFAVHSDCYPTIPECVVHLREIQSRTNIESVFLATNLKSGDHEYSLLRDEFGKSLHTVNREAMCTIWRRITGKECRSIDRLIVEMAVASMGSFFVFNRYSSLSGTIFEMTSIHNRTIGPLDNPTNVVTW